MCYNLLVNFPQDQCYFLGELTGNCFVGNPAGYHSTEPVQKDAQVIKVQPIAVPIIPVDELRDITDNFGSKALVGEGSYGRVYFGVLKSGQAAAIKKLDSSKQPDQEFLAQVG